MSYIDDHPTQFNYTKRVRRRVVNRVQRRFPWLTYVNTYWDHPPGFGAWPVNWYTRLSVDFWGGGPTKRAADYNGFRGKPLPPALGDKIFHMLFNAKRGPEIDWIIWRGRMWWNPKTGGPGWTVAPGGPAGSDAAHMFHLHVTYIAGT